MMLHNILLVLYDALVVLLVGNMLLSYFPRWRYHPLGQLISRCSEPLLQPIRRIIPPIKTGNGARLDFSPAICLFIIYLLLEVLDNMLGVRMR